MCGIKDSSVEQLGLGADLNLSLTQKKYQTMQLNLKTEAD